MIGRETLIVTALGAAIGVWPGLWLASRLAEAMQGRGLLPGTFEIAPGGIPVVVAVGITLLASQISASLAGRRAGRVRPIEALTTAATPSARLGTARSIVAVLAVTGTGALFVTTSSVRGSLAPAVALGLFCTAMLAVWLLAPFLVRAGLRVLALPFGRLSGSRRVSRRRQHTLAGTAAGVRGHAACTDRRHRRHDLVPADDARSPARKPRAPNGSSPTMSSTPDQPVFGSKRSRSSLSAVTGAVIGLASTTIFANFELDPYVATAVAPGRLADVLDLGIVDGSVEQLRAGEVMVSEDAAASMGVGVGDHVDIRLGDGTAAAPWSWPSTNARWDSATSCCPGNSSNATSPTGAISLVLVDDGGDAEVTRASLAHFETDHPGTRVGGREIVQAGEDANAQTQAWVGYVLLGLVIVFCTFAVFNTLMLAISERKREFALLRLTGGTHRQVITMMITEAAMVIVTGLVLGGAIAAVTVMPVSKAVTGSFQPHTPAMYVAAIVAMTGVIGLTASLLPTLARLRSRPVEAIGARE